MRTAGIGVGCIEAAMYMAALFVFSAFVAGELQKKVTSTRLRPVNGDLAAGHLECHKSELTGFWLNTSLRAQKLRSWSKRKRWTHLNGIETVDLQLRDCFIQLRHILEMRIILFPDLLIFLYVCTSSVHFLKCTVFMPTAFALRE